MKIVIGYPPIEQNKGTPLLSQNRQFQFFTSPTYIYPMIPAYAATLAKQAGHEVLWMDGIAEVKSYDMWFKELKNVGPDLILIETKTPVIKRHWEMIKAWKKKMPEMKVVMVGDHITFLPQETMDNCPVDFLITGGDYDFVLLDLLQALEKNKAMPAGVWGRDPKTEDVWNTGPADLKHTLDELPFIDRDLTRWELYAYENGNFKYKPGTYVYSGRDCWWNRCTFCVWDQVLYPRGSYRSFSAKRLFAEVKHVVDNYGIKEVFDDAGSLFVGPKLKEFCELMISSGYNKKVTFSCNMRLNALNQEYYDLMGKANFRFILYGLESANQETLDKIDKGLKVEEIEEGVKMAKKSGLEPHVTIMLGYPWETEEMAMNTINKAKDLFNKGYIDSMQATILIPYPGTTLYKQCLENDWFAVDPQDYEAFDMRGPVMKTPFSKKRLLELTQALYSSFLTPRFMLRKILSVRTFDDVKYFFMAGKKLFGHLTDFKG
jgi:radical SAM superfamily enzyme YgiQ (UPF0313 family)